MSTFGNRALYGGFTDEIQKISSAASETFAFGTDVAKTVARKASPTGATVMNRIRPQPTTMNSVAKTVARKASPRGATVAKPRRNEAVADLLKRIKGTPSKPPAPAARPPAPAAKPPAAAPAAKPADPDWHGKAALGIAGVGTGATIIGSRR